MPKTLEFNDTPAFTRECVNNWLAHAKKDPKTSTVQIALLEDVLKLIDVAVSVLEPGPAEPAKK